MTINYSTRKAQMYRDEFLCLDALVVRAQVRDGFWPTRAIADTSGLSTSQTRGHLTRLEAAGLVEANRNTRDILWRITPKGHAVYGDLTP